MSAAKPVQLYNPFAPLTAAGTRQPFSGNLIPSSFISKAARADSFLHLLSAANHGPGLLNNLIYSTHSYINGDQGDVKVD